MVSHTYTPLPQHSVLQSLVRLYRYSPTHCIHSSSAGKSVQRPCQHCGSNPSGSLHCPSGPNCCCSVQGNPSPSPKLPFTLIGIALSRLKFRNCSSVVREKSVPRGIFVVKSCMASKSPLMSRPLVRLGSRAGSMSGRTGYVGTGGSLSFGVSGYGGIVFCSSYRCHESGLLIWLGTGFCELA